MLATLTLALAPTTVQEPVVLLTRGDEVPGQPGSEVVGMGATTVNDAGGWAVMITRKNALNERDQIVGSRWEGDPVGLIHNEGNYSGFWQGNFFDQITLDDAGRACYRAGDMVSSNVPKTVYQNGLLLMKVGDPLPSDPTRDWRGRFAVETSRDGEAYFLAQYGFEGSNSIGEGIFRGPDAVPVLQSGDVIPGIPQPLPTTLPPSQVGSSQELFHEFDVSPSGEHVAAVVDVPGGFSGELRLLVVDGAPYGIGGQTVQQEQQTGLMDNERWRDFPAVDVQDDGGVIFGALTSFSITGSTDFGVILVDGAEVYRRESPSPMSTVPTTPVGVDRSATGDWVAGLESGGGGAWNNEIVVNGLIVLRGGDRVDLDGDGVLDADLHEIVGTPVIDEQRRVFVTYQLLPDVQPPTGGATASWASLRIQIEDLHTNRSEISAVEGGPIGFRMFAPVEQRGRLRLLLGSLSGTSPGLPLAAGTLPLVVDAYTDLFLSGAAPIDTALDRLGPSGESEAVLDVPPGVLQPLVGGAMHHAYIVLDEAGAVSFVSQAVGTQIVP